MKLFALLLFLLMLAPAGPAQETEVISEEPPVTATEPVIAPAGADTQAVDQQKPEAAPRIDAAASRPVDLKPIMTTVKRYFQQMDYVSADKTVNAALELKSDDYEAIKYKGMIAFKLGRLEESAKYLELAATANARDAELLFYQGALYEKQGEFIKAEKAFLRHAEFGAFNTYASLMEKYAGFVSAKAAKMRARQAVESEAAIGVSKIEPNVIAVVTFANTGSKKNLDPLGKGLAEMVATDLAQIERFRVVERVQMQAVVDELALGQTGLLEEGQSERTGKLLGAERVVNGSFGSDGTTFRMNAGVADAITGGVRPVEGVSGPLKNLFKTEKALVFKIVTELGLILTDSERKKIEVIPTENVLAFLAYAKGLDAEDRGDFPAARKYYLQAAKEASVKAECARAGDLTRVAKSAAGGTGVFATPVFTVGNLHFSARGSASLFTLNSATASFMPEARILSKSRAVAGEGVIPAASSSGVPARNSYIDAFDIGFGGGSKTIPVNAPIPDGM
jgi:TolB-like protein